ncbi:MAG: ATP-binding protein [Gemmatimonas sp.]
MMADRTERAPAVLPMGSIDRVLRSRMVVPFVLIMLGVATVGMLAVRERLDKAHVALVFLLVVLVGSAAGRIAGVLTGVVAFTLFNFFFLRPYNTLLVNDPLDWLVLVTFLATSLVAAQLLHREREQARIAGNRARDLDRLATTGAETLNAVRASDALSAIARVIRESLQVSRCELYMGTRTSPIDRVATTDAAPTPRDQPGLVRFVIDNGNAVAERSDGTTHVMSTLDAAPDVPADARGLCMPLTLRSETIGALQLHAAQSLGFGAEQWRILRSLSYYAALALARRKLEIADETAEQLRRADAMKDALLASVSHDLRTPLTTISGLAHEIAREGSERARIIGDEADHLSRMVDQLLELSQLEAGGDRPMGAINTADDLVGGALQRVAAAWPQRIFAVDAGQEMLTGRFDLHQSIRIVANLLDNAAKYSIPNAPVELRVVRSGEHLELTVRDSGPVIAESEREKIFLPFYRAPGSVPDVRGSGLGLAIARQLADAQRGALRCVGNDQGGNDFILQLPAVVVPG